MSKIVKILSKSLDSIDKYIELFLDFYVTLYSDSGIWSEEFIIEDYRVKAKKLHRNILDYIQNRMSEELLPYELLDFGKRKCILTIEQRRLEIIYEESDTERVIHEIKIEHR